MSIFAATYSTLRMGNYINIGNTGFQSARNGEYVDKSGLISIVNGTLFTERRFSCVTRCRRFGKSMAAKMLNAYYDQSCDSRSLFADLEIAKDPSFEKYLNKYPVIYLDLTNFMQEKDAAISLSSTSGMPSAASSPLAPRLWTVTWGGFAVCSRASMPSVCLPVSI